MKKIAVTVFTVALILTSVFTLSGCGSDTTSTDNSTPDTSSTTPQSSSSEPSSQQTTVSDIISLPESSDTSSSDNSTVNDLRTQIVATAEALVGVDYVSGMATPEQGFDNSGLIYYVLRENGFINCPRGTAAQKEMGTTVSFDEIEPGDILFFTDKDSETGETIDFGGIYTGNGQLIYSPYPGEKVKFADINSTYWKNSFNCAVRVA
ncbi:MAG: C40 family peptidase [Ruminiclostridium sp.]